LHFYAEFTDDLARGQYKVIVTVVQYLPGVLTTQVAVLPQGTVMAT
jgi:hypothetical protein